MEHKDTAPAEMQQQYTPSEATPPPLLGPAEIKEARVLLIELELDWKTLFSPVSKTLAAQIHRTGTTGDDLFVALNDLSRAGRTTDARVPLADLLEAAADLRSDRKEAPRVRQLAWLVRTRLAAAEGTAPPPAAVDSLSSIAPPPNSEAPLATTVPPPATAAAEPRAPSTRCIAVAGAVGGVCTAAAIHMAMPGRFGGPPPLTASMTDMVAAGIPSGAAGLLLMWRCAEIRRGMGALMNAVLDALVLVTGGLLLLAAHLFCTKDSAPEREPTWLLGLALFAGVGAVMCTRMKRFTTVGGYAVVLPAVSAAVAGGCAFALAVSTSPFGGAPRSEVLGRILVPMYSTLVFLVSSYGILLVRAWLAGMSSAASQPLPHARRQLGVLLGTLALLAAPPLVRRLVTPAQGSSAPDRGCHSFGSRLDYLRSQAALEREATEIVFLTLKPANAFTTDEYLQRVGLPLLRERWAQDSEAIRGVMANRAAGLRRRLAAGELSRVTLLFVEGEPQRDLERTRPHLRAVVARRYLDLVSRARQAPSVVFVCAVPRSVYDAEMGTLDGAALILSNEDELLAIGRQLQGPFGPMEEAGRDRIYHGARSLALSRAMGEMADRCTAEETERTLDAIEVLAAEALRSN